MVVDRAPALWRSGRGGGRPGCRARPRRSGTRRCRLHPRKQLLVKRETLRGGVRRRDDLDRVAGPLSPGVHALLADLVFLAERAARDGDVHRPGAGGGDEASGKAETGDQAWHGDPP